MTRISKILRKPRSFFCLAVLLVLLISAGVSAAVMELAIDDGVSENSIGFGGGQLFWMNRFSPTFPLTITGVKARFESVSIGDTIEIVLLQDTDGDGDPTNAVPVYSQDFAVQNNDGVTWDQFTLTTPVTFTGPGDVIVGAINRDGDPFYADYPADIDQSSTQGRSWVGWNNSFVVADPFGGPASLDNFNLIDNSGYPGNWLLRAVLDAAAPSGTVGINSGAASTNSSSVTLNLSASDGSGGGVDKMRFRNEGGGWSAWEAYATTKAWVVTTGDGSKKVYAQFKDKGGNESAEVSDDILLDTVQPTATVASPPISTKVSKTPNFSVPWSGTDPAPGSGVASYDVQVKVGPSGAWVNWQTATAAKTAVFKGKVGKTYFFRARANDAAGNVGAWSAESKTIVPFDQDAHVAGRSGFNGYAAKPKSKYFKGTVRFAGQGGEALSYGFKGKQFSLIGTKGANLGEAEIYVDGKLKKVVNAFAAKTSYRQVLFSITFKKLAKHEVKVINKGTAGHPGFELDAHVVQP